MVLNLRAYFFLKAQVSGMAARPRSPDGAHALRCQTSHGGVRAAVKACNRCFYLKHRAAYARRFPWLGETPPASCWGLRCSHCQVDLYRNVTSSDLTSRSQTKMQAIDFVRHEERSRHIQASSEPQVAGHAPDSTGTDVPTPAQVRLAVEVARSFGGAQDYQRRAQLPGRSDHVNFPPAFNGAASFGRIIELLAGLLLLSLSPKTPNQKF